MAAGLRIRGKSGLHEATVPGNARPGQPEGKRHREQSARHVRVRVKRWGKSPPRDGQPDRHGKPHREQCRIGASRRLILSGISRQGRFSPRGPGWQLEPVGNGGPRGMVIPSRQREGQNPAYRPSAQWPQATRPPRDSRSTRKWAAWPASRIDARQSADAGRDRPAGRDAGEDGCARRRGGIQKMMDQWLGGAGQRARRRRRALAAF
jgi:hypothetical protein